MNRRQALRTAIVAGAGLVGMAGCGSTSAPRTARQSAGGRARPVTHTASASPSASASPGVRLPPEVTHGPRNRAAVALTFHGQGDPRMGKRLLTELEAGGARITVLAVGTWLSEQPALARRILDGGHELGNHTQHHLAIAAMSAAQAFAEIDGCARTLRRLTGSIGTWFRPSQTQHSTALIRAEARRPATEPACPTMSTPWITRIRWPAWSSAIRCRRSPTAPSSACTSATPRRSMRLGRSSMGCALVAYVPSR